MEKLIDKDKIINSFEDELKLTNSITEAKKKCRCGHTQLVPPVKGREFDLCTYCNGRLYVDDNKQLEYNKKVNREEFVSKFMAYLSFRKDVTNERYN